MKKTAIGTKVYLPPELRNIIGQQTDLVSTKTDIYSFGVVIILFLFIVYFIL